jgi:flagellar hook-length control protein FliK
MVANGSPQKPAKAAPAASDNSKTQPQGSTAAVLEAVSATPTFSDPQTSSVQPLPLHGNGDSSKSNAATAASSPPSHTTANDSPAAPATTSPPAPTPAAVIPAPVQPHPAAQADASNAAVVTAAPPLPPATPHVATPISAQLQVLQSDPEDASPNLAALAVTIAAKSAGGAKHFDIRLDPPELGRVDVRLSVDATGRAQAALTIEKPQTLELLQKDSPQLERALKDAGLDLSQSGLNFSLKGQQQQQGSNGGNASTGRQRLAVRAIVAADAVSTLSAAAPTSDARLDIRV